MAGSGLGFVSGKQPMSTPPQTPRSTSGSVSGAKREASESGTEEGGDVKRRRVAPTLVDQSLPTSQ